MSDIFSGFSSDSSMIRTRAIPGSAARSVFKSAPTDKTLAIETLNAQTKLGLWISLLDSNSSAFREVRSILQLKSSQDKGLLQSYYGEFAKITLDVLKGYPFSETNRMHLKDDCNNPFWSAINAQGVDELRNILKNKNNLSLFLSKDALIGLNRPWKLLDSHELEFFARLRRIYDAACSTKNMAGVRGSNTKTIQDDAIDAILTIAKKADLFENLWNIAEKKIALFDLYQKNQQVAVKTVETSAPRSVGFFSGSKSSTEPKPTITIDVPSGKMPVAAQPKSVGFFTLGLGKNNKPAASETPKLGR